MTRTSKLEQAGGCDEKAAETRMFTVDEDVGRSDD